MSDAVTLYIVKATFILLIAASALTWAIVIVKALQNFRLNAKRRAFTARSRRPPGCLRPTSS